MSSEGDQIIYVFNKILSAYALVLIILGTIGNGLVFAICLSKNLRSKTTFKFLAFMSLSDIFALYGWNLDHFTSTYYNFYYNTLTLAGCRFETFVQYSACQYSAWMLVREEEFFDVFLLRNLIINQKINKILADRSQLH
jgi:hypothetical protein